MDDLQEGWARPTFSVFDAVADWPGAGARVFLKRSAKRSQRRRHNPKKAKRWVPRASWFSENRNELWAERRVFVETPAARLN